MPTEEQIKQFGRINAGYPIGERIKPSHGDLYFDGRIEMHNKPFALLNYRKRELMKQGILSKRLKIKSL